MVTDSKSLNHRLKELGSANQEKLISMWSLDLLETADMHKTYDSMQSPREKAGVAKVEISLIKAGLSTASSISVKKRKDYEFICQEEFESKAAEWKREQHRKIKFL